MCNWRWGGFVFSGSVIGEGGSGGAGLLAQALIGFVAPLQGTVICPVYPGSCPGLCCVAPSEQLRQCKRCLAFRLGTLVGVGGR